MYDKMDGESNTATSSELHPITYGKLKSKARNSAVGWAKRNGLGAAGQTLAEIIGRSSHKDPWTWLEMHGATETAHHFGIGRRTYFRHLAVLEDAGVLVSERRRSDRVPGLYPARRVPEEVIVKIVEGLPLVDETQSPESAKLALSCSDAEGSIGSLRVPIVHSSDSASQERVSHEAAEKPGNTDDSASSGDNTTSAYNYRSSKEETKRTGSARSGRRLRRRSEDALHRKLGLDAPSRLVTPWRSTDPAPGSATVPDPASEGRPPIPTTEASVPARWTGDDDLAMFGVDPTETTRPTGESSRKTTSTTRIAQAFEREWTEMLSRRTNRDRMRLPALPWPLGGKARFNAWIKKQLMPRCNNDEEQAIAIVTAYCQAVGRRQVPHPRPDSIPFVELGRHFDRLKSQASRSTRLPQERSEQSQAAEAPPRPTASSRLERLREAAAAGDRQAQIDLEVEEHLASLDAASRYHDERWSGQ